MQESIELDLKNIRIKHKKKKSKEKKITKRKRIENLSVIYK
jgi:hypothetical protein